MPKITRELIDTISDTIAYGPNTIIVGEQVYCTFYGKPVIATVLDYGRANTGSGWHVGLAEFGIMDASWCVPVGLITPAAVLLYAK